MSCRRDSRPFRPPLTFVLLISKMPPGRTSRMIWSWSTSDGGVAGGFGSGSWMSIVFRDAGTIIMKMIRSTSSTSIIGVMLGSDVSPPPPPEENAISVPSRRRRHRLGALLLLGDQPAHDDAARGRHVERLGHLRVVQALVGLHVQDELVAALGLEDPRELRTQLVVRDRVAVQVVLPVDVDAEHLIGILLRVRLQVGAARRHRGEA